MSARPWRGSSGLGSPLMIAALYDLEQRLYRNQVLCKSSQVLFGFPISLAKIFKFEKAPGESSLSWSVLIIASTIPPNRGGGTKSYSRNPNRVNTFCKDLGVKNSNNLLKGD